MGEKLQDIGWGNDFLNITFKTKQKKKKIDKLDYSKSRNFFALNDMTNRIKRQPTE